MRRLGDRQRLVAAAETPIALPAEPYTMVDSNWPELDGEQLRYLDHTWELTGDVDVRNGGELLAVGARQTDDVRGESAVLFFGLDGSGDSLNPGNLGGHFDRLEREGDDRFLVVKTDGGTYRYELRRLEYE